MSKPHRQSYTAVRAFRIFTGWMKYLRWLLFPFSLLYGLVVVIRNWCYHMGIFKSANFNLPIISVGNLDAGGAGKTPLTEYLIRLLKPSYRLATLSRGYGRATKGFLLVETTSSASQTGDEPLQLKHKFADITVAVCENRVAGVEQLKTNSQVILLDDAYQHRAIKPGFSILLFDYHQLKTPALLLPAGNRREPFIGRERADVIIISKCPADIDARQQQILREKMALFAHQQLFFTTIAYQPLTGRSGEAAPLQIDEDTAVFLLTGIAWPQPMLNYLKQFSRQIIHHKYPDHHRFSLKNITKLADEFKACPAHKKIIITTEKDMQRLEERELAGITKQLPIYTLPIAVDFLNNGGAAFDELINNYVRKHTAHSGIH